MVVGARALHVEKSNRNNIKTKSAKHKYANDSRRAFTIWFFFCLTRNIKCVINRIGKKSSWYLLEIGTLHTTYHSREDVFEKKMKFRKISSDRIIYLCIWCFIDSSLSMSTLTLIRIIRIIIISKYYWNGWKIKPSITHWSKIRINRWRKIVIEFHLIAAYVCTAVKISFRNSTIGT